MVRSVLRQTVLFLKQEDGPTAVEYAVMLALIIAVCVVAVTTIGQNTNEIYMNSVLKKGLGGGS
jgi:pilus assembly protein Flp/PilA